MVLNRYAQFLLTSALCLVSCSLAYAQNWVALVGGEDWALYYKLNVPRQGGDTIRVETTIDYFAAPITVDGKKIRSAVITALHDCEGMRIKRLSAIGFSGREGEGKVLWFDMAMYKWERPTKETPLYVFLEAGCKHFL
jgi:hypothetical protein